MKHLSLQKVWLLPDLAVKQTVNPTTMWTSAKISRCLSETENSNIFTLKQAVLILSAVHTDAWVGVKTTPLVNWSFTILLLCVNGIDLYQTDTEMSV